MKAAEVRDLTPDQISEEMLKLKKEQFNLRFQRASGQLENTARTRQIRRDIARMQTILNERAATGAAAPKAKAVKAKAPRAKSAKKK